MRDPSGAALVAAPEASDPWVFQAECVEAFMASWRARGFSPVTIENDIGLLKRTLAASHVLDGCGVAPRTIGNTRLVELANTMDPKLVAAAFGTPKASCSTYPTASTRGGSFSALVSAIASSKAAPETAAVAEAGAFKRGGVGSQRSSGAHFCDGFARAAADFAPGRVSWDAAAVVNGEALVDDQFWDGPWYRGADRGVRSLVPAQRRR